MIIFSSVGDGERFFPVGIFSSKHLTKLVEKRKLA